MLHRTFAEQFDSTKAATTSKPGNDTHDGDDFVPNSQEQSFLEWVSANGISLNGARMKMSPYGGYGLFSSRPISKGEVCVSVPHNLIISTDYIFTLPLGRAVRNLNRALVSDGHSPLPECCALYVYMILQRGAKGGRHHVWMNTIPQKYSDPLWYSEEEACLFEGTNVGRALETLKSKLVTWHALLFPKLFEMIEEDDKGCDLDQCDRSIFTLEALRWAHSAYTSRGFTASLAHTLASQKLRSDHGMNISAAGVGEEGEVVGVLIPFLDMVNHCLQPSLAWESDALPLISEVSSDAKDGPELKSMDIEGDVTTNAAGTSSTGNVPSYRSTSSFVHFRATRNVTANEELFITYGNKSNSELLVGYGFCVPDFQHDSFPVPVGMGGKSASLVAAKRALIQELDLSLEENMLNTNELPAALLSTLSIAVMDEVEMYHFQSARCWGDLSRRVPFDPSIRSRALDALHHLVSNQLEFGLSSTQKIVQQVCTFIGRDVSELDSIIPSLQTEEQGSLVAIPCLKLLTTCVKLVLQGSGDAKYQPNFSVVNALLYRMGQIFTLAVSKAMVDQCAVSLAHEYAPSASELLAAAQESPAARKDKWTGWFESFGGQSLMKPLNWSGDSCAADQIETGSHAPVVVGAVEGACPVGGILFACPASALISCETSTPAVASIALALSDAFANEASVTLTRSVLEVVVTLLCEKAIGAESKWHDFFAVCGTDSAVRRCSDILCSVSEASGSETAFNFGLTSICARLSSLVDSFCAFSSSAVAHALESLKEVDSGSSSVSFDSTIADLVAPLVGNKSEIEWAIGMVLTYGICVDEQNIFVVPSCAPHRFAPSRESNSDILFLDEEMVLCFEAKEDLSVSDIVTLPFSASCPMHLLLGAAVTLLGADPSDDLDTQRSISLQDALLLDQQTSDVQMFYPCASHLLADEPVLSNDAVCVDFRDILKGAKATGLKVSKKHVLLATELQLLQNTMYVSRRSLPAELLLCAELFSLPKKSVSAALSRSNGAGELRKKLLSLSNACHRDVIQATLDHVVARLQSAAPSVSSNPYLSRLAKSKLAICRDVLSLLNSQ